MNQVKEKLLKIWNKPYMDKIQEHKKRGFVFCVNECQKDILITGINPSCRKGEEEYQENGFDFETALKCNDTYFSPIRKMLFSEDGKVDLREKTAYLDIFYFREKDQSVLKKQFLKKDLNFLVEQLEITQDTIENVIKPKLIIVKNKESATYFGALANNGIIWMGYNLQSLKEIKNGDYKIGDLYRIGGLGISEFRINQKSIQKTNLVGTLVLVTPHISQFLKKEKRPTPKLIEDLLNNKL